ncbi:MAG: AraC family transcriptional regulator, partial [Brumimicrobium sp.]|nr:AraC family transcriptional regulator [Brumimicrobium sp.]
MNLYIKNMVCDRCKMVVDSMLRDMNLHPLKISLGVVEIAENELHQKDILVQKLRAVGFDLLEDKRNQTKEKIKNLITEKINYLHFSNENLSVYLSRELAQDYSSLSHLFSDLQ